MALQPSHPAGFMTTNEETTPQPAKLKGRSIDRLIDTLGRSDENWLNIGTVYKTASFQGVDTQKKLTAQKQDNMTNEAIGIVVFAVLSGVLTIAAAAASVQAASNPATPSTNNPHTTANAGLGDAFSKFTDNMKTAKGLEGASTAGSRIADQSGTAYSTVKRSQQAKLQTEQEMDKEMGLNTALQGLGNINSTLSSNHTTAMGILQTYTKA
jgi:hypothetical protein